MHIFLSYAREDTGRAETLARALESRGWTVWWDRRITPGRSFDQVIQGALDAAACVVVLWSHASVQSDWVKEEAAAGADRGVLVPCLIDDVRIPLGFGRIQSARLIDWHGDASHAEFDRLCQAIAAHIGPPPHRRAEPAVAGREEPAVVPAKPRGDRLLLPEQPQGDVEPEPLPVVRSRRVRLLVLGAGGLLVAWAGYAWLGPGATGGGDAGPPAAAVDSTFAPAGTTSVPAGTTSAPTGATATPADPASAPAPGTPPALDGVRAAELERRAGAEPANAAVRVELGNLYYGAERFDLAIPWYEAALAIEPSNVNASTDLGVCFYRTNQVDRALAQFNWSLVVDPSHAVTLYNQGLVRALGRQDLEGAARSWERVVALAPGTEVARYAQQGLDSLRASQPAPGAAGTGGRGDGAAAHEDAVRQFVADFLAASVAGDVDRLLSFYGDRVDYYAEGLRDRSFIRRDKEAYYRRWPDVTNRFDGPVAIRPGQAPGRWTVEFTTRYQVRSADRRAQASGRTEVALEIASVKGALKVVGQKERVVGG